MSKPRSPYPSFSSLSFWYGLVNLILWYGFDLIPWWIWFCGMSLTWFLGQNLPNSSFLERKKTCYIACGWNILVSWTVFGTQVPIHFLLDEVWHWPKKKEKKRWNSSLRNSSSICTELKVPKLEFSVKNLGTRVQCKKSWNSSFRDSSSVWI